MFGYEPIVVDGNNEYELESGEILSKEEVLREAMSEEDKEKLKEKLSSLKDELGTLIGTAEDVIDKDISAAKLAEINNIVQELEKASLNLGASALAEDRSDKPLTEE